MEEISASLEEMDRRVAVMEFLSVVYFDKSDDSPLMLMLKQIK